ncbi:MAG TPA: hypothetical protein VK158_04960 [Acidobacteriota bacterium]|nr:hypothetical protein [Acidobacteriota bacterium]
MTDPLQPLHDVYSNYIQHAKTLELFPQSQLAQVLGFADGEVHQGLAYLTLLDLAVWKISVYDWQLLERDFRHIDIGCPFTLERFMDDDGLARTKPVSVYGIFCKDKSPFFIDNLIQTLDMKLIAQSKYTNGHVDVLETVVEDQPFTMLHAPQKNIIGVPRYSPKQYIDLPARHNRMWEHFNKTPNPVPKIGTNQQVA